MESTKCIVRAMFTEYNPYRNYISRYVTSITLKPKLLTLVPYCDMEQFHVMMRNDYLTEDVLNKRREETSNSDCVSRYATTMQLSS